jgi:hypothetical protein
MINLADSMNACCFCFRRPGGLYRILSSERWDGLQFGYGPD